MELFMKSLKNHLAFVIPLVFMLLTFSIYFFTNNIINDYKKSISKDYSIVIITHTPLIKKNMKEVAGLAITKVQVLKKDEIVNKLKKDLSSESIYLLKRKLPFFYKIHLRDFPTSSELSKIKNELQENKNIKNIEIFSKNHNQVYLLLLILNKLVIIVFTIISIFTIIIISKQVKIWFYENARQITILQLHGASILYSASRIIKQALVGAFVAFFLVSSLLAFVAFNMKMFIPLELQEIVQTTINLELQILILFFLSFGISFITVMSVLISYKISNE